MAAPIAGSIPTLLQRIRSGSPASQAEALADLDAATVAGAAEPCQAVIVAGGLDVLVQGLRSSSTEVQTNAAIVLCNVFASGQAERSAVVRAGAIPALARLLQQAGCWGGHPEGSTLGKYVQQTAIGMLCDLFIFNQEARAPIAAAAATIVPAAVQALQQGSSGLEITVTVAEGTAAMAVHSAELSAAIADAGGIPPLVRLLCHSSAAVSAAGALSQISSRSQQLCLDVLQAGAAPALVECLSSADDRLQRNASGALCNLAAHCAGPLAAAGAIPALVHLLKHSSNGFVHRNAAGALGNMALGSWERSTAIVAAGGIPILKGLLGSSRDDVQGWAGGTLETIAEALASRGSESAAAAAAPAAAAQQLAGAGASDSAQQQRRAPRACAAEGCGATRGLKRCAGCGVVRYCSLDCQRAHWPNHRRACKAAQGRVAQ